MKKLINHKPNKSCKSVLTCTGLSKDVGMQTKHHRKRKRLDGSLEVKVSPCGFALTWQQSDPKATEMIVGARGIRQGKKPKTRDDYIKLSSRLSRRELVHLVACCLQESEDNMRGQSTMPKNCSYQEFKKQLCPKDWAMRKRGVLQEGPLAGWLRNCDDFSVFHDFKLINP